MASLRSAIGLAIKGRLESITEANGYPIGVKKVFYDRIPLGLELAPEEMPALFLLDDGAAMNHEHGLVNVVRAWRVQIVDGETADDDRMNELIRLVAKALWANSPSAQVQDQFRSMHPAVYQMAMTEDETDLHMIEGNRIASAQFLVHYRTRPYDL